MTVTTRVLEVLHSLFSRAAKPSAATTPPENCLTCGTKLNVADDPLSLDCGGDCWGCVSELEAHGLDVSLQEYRNDPGRFVPRFEK